MKWDEINSKYPHAMQDLMNWMTRGDFAKEPEKFKRIFAKTQYGFAIDILCNASDQDEGVLLTIGTWDNEIDSDRDLYDFFDDKGIYALIVLRGVNSWVYDIRNPQLNLLTQASFPGSFNSRLLAEANAFEKAFELLEKTHE
jgi:hypothetical protein